MNRRQWLLVPLLALWLSGCAGSKWAAMTREERLGVLEEFSQQLNATAARMQPQVLYNTTGQVCTVSGRFVSCLP